MNPCCWRGPGSIGGAPAGWTPSKAADRRWAVISGWDSPRGSVDPGSVLVGCRSDCDGLCCDGLAEAGRARLGPRRRRGGRSRLELDDPKADHAVGDAQRALQRLEHLAATVELQQVVLGV